MERDFLKQSIRRELDYYRDGLFNEDGDEEWVRAWSAPDDDSMAENGFLNVAMARTSDRPMPVPPASRVGARSVR